MYIWKLGQHLGHGFESEIYDVTRRNDETVFENNLFHFNTAPYLSCFLASMAAYVRCRTEGHAPDAHSTIRIRLEKSLPSTNQKESRTKNPYYVF